MKGKKTEISGKTHQNGGFGSGVGFVLACVGSAVGMGNIWMFPYRVGQYGGGAFLVPYILFVALFGLVGLSAEFAIGRRAGTGTLGAYEYCWNKRKKGKLGYVLGWIPLMGSLGIAIGYSVIVGWVLRSLGGSLTGALLTEDAATYFSQATGDFGSVPWHLIIVAVSALILMFGATKGIEKINKIISNIHKKLTGNREDIKIVYEPSNGALSFEQALLKNKEKDLRIKSTSVGPHRDDIAFLVSDIDIRKYGSQGQQRTAALSLKLSEIELVKQSIHDTPVLLLDDVLSELDKHRQNYLLDSIHDIQTLITCTGVDEFVNHRFSINKVFHVQNGQVTKEN